MALGRLDEAEEHLSAAVALATTIGAPGYVAEADYHLATALLARGDRTRARTAAAECAGLVAALGMAAYAERAAELQAELADDPVLSPREEEVAALVAEGLTNRQIAQRLVISAAHGAEPRAAHPYEAGVRHARADRCVAGEYPMSISADGLVAAGS